MAGEAGGSRRAKGLWPHALVFRGQRGGRWQVAAGWGGVGGQEERPRGGQGPVGWAEELGFTLGSPGSRVTPSAWALFADWPSLCCSPSLVARHVATQWWWAR